MCQAASFIAGQCFGREECFSNFLNFSVIIDLIFHSCRSIRLSKQITKMKAYPIKPQNKIYYLQFQNKIILGCSTISLYFFHFFLSVSRRLNWNFPLLT